MAARLRIGRSHVPASFYSAPITQTHALSVGFPTTCRSPEREPRPACDDPGGEVPSERTADRGRTGKEQSQKRQCRADKSTSSVTCTLRRSAFIRQIISWLAVLFFTDRGNARQLEALLLGSL